MASSANMLTMDRHYKARLHGDRLEWLEDERPDCDGEEVVVAVPTRRRSDGAAMAAALEEIAKLGGTPSIPDPVAWQREIRRDRPLPGRDQE